MGLSNNEGLTQSPVGPDDPHVALYTGPIPALGAQNEQGGRKRREWGAPVPAERDVQHQVLRGEELADIARARGPRRARRAPRRDIQAPIARRRRYARRHVRPAPEPNTTPTHRISTHAKEEEGGGRGDAQDAGGVELRGPHAAARGGEPAEVAVRLRLGDEAAGRGRAVRPAEHAALVRRRGRVEAARGRAALDELGAWVGVGWDSLH